MKKQFTNPPNLKKYKIDASLIIKPGEERKGDY